MLMGRDTGKRALLRLRKKWQDNINLDLRERDRVDVRFMELV
jgi:hypothetical protein